MLAQIPVYPQYYTVEDVLNDAFNEVSMLSNEMKRMEEEMMHDASKEILMRYARISERFEALGGYETDVKKDKVCNGLLIDKAMRCREFRTLSGGEKTRVNLCRLILQNTEILLLDEPTNHLDLSSVEWLEDFLSSYSGTVVTVSHDRYFLDKVISRVIEIEDHKCTLYSGNYSAYTVEKERRFIEQLRQYNKEQAKIKQLSDAADKLHLWAFMGNDALHKRAFSIEKRIENIAKTDKPKKDKVMTASFNSGSIKADETFKLCGISKSYGDKTILNDISFVVRNNEKLGIIGDNGVGKSTLLKLILGKESPDNGYIRVGPSVKIGYMSQEIHFEDPEDTVLQYVIDNLYCSQDSARNRLAAFMFYGEDVFKQIKDLSGGEKSRLILCVLMANEINMLVLDEPTNHLDMASRQWIENCVEGFEGTLLFVSHDRYFINKFAQRIWHLSGDGRIDDFIGSYEQFKNSVKKEQIIMPTKVHKEEKQVRTEKTKRPSARKILSVEKEIEKLESRLREVEALMAECQSDYVKLQELCDEKEKLEEEILGLYDIWEKMNEG